MKSIFHAHHTVLICLIAVSALVADRSAAAAEAKAILLLRGEKWWGGWSVDGPLMPFDHTTSLRRDLYADNGGNQAQPFLVSSNGRYVWSEKPFAFEFRDGVLHIGRTWGPVQREQAGDTLRSAFLAAARRHFPADGRIPDPVMFARPQYNTWIELMYDQNERDILRYARAVKSNGYPTGVLMIDDNWQETYGRWQFAPRRFPNPKAMMAELHALGFRVMLWVCPFVSADSEEFRALEKKAGLLMEPAAVAAGPRLAATVRWWNGVSGCLDLSNPASRVWLKAQLDALIRDFGVDGFKFDAGDAEFYRGNVVSHAAALPNEHTEFFAQLGLEYPLNEFRASWKLAGRPLAQRLRDKAHRWEDLRALIPGMLAQGLMGYAFTCPDMIGGGEFTSFLDGAVIDGELIVRSAQVHALMPMMQFSVAPWRILPRGQHEICRRMAELHTQHGERFVALARQAARTGEPIVRPLAWQWPHTDYEDIKDQFMLGDDIMVAPVVEKGARERSVVFPPGSWRGDDQTLTIGPSTRTIKAPLERLPWFHREDPTAR